MISLDASQRKCSPMPSAASLEQGPTVGPCRPDRRPARARRIPVLGPGPGRRRELLHRFRNPDSTGELADEEAREAISRRTALRGLGVSLALPLLEAMDRATRCVPDRGRWGTEPSVTIGLRLRPQRRAHARLDRRASLGEGFELPPILELLRAVKDDILVLSGSDLPELRRGPSAMAGATTPGRWPAS